MVAVQGSYRSLVLSHGEALRLLSVAEGHCSGLIKSEGGRDQGNHLCLSDVMRREASCSWT